VGKWTAEIWIYNYQLSSKVNLPPQRNSKSEVNLHFDVYVVLTFLSGVFNFSESEELCQFAKKRGFNDSVVNSACHRIQQTFSTVNVAEGKRTRESHLRLLFFHITWLSGILRNFKFL